MSNLENFRLWQIFEKKAEKEQVVMVEKLVKRASTMLDRIIETFPTYTLHNHIHAENVVSWMSKLLGNEIGKITALEGTILILSAYYHDIGMVFTEEERNNLANEEKFEEFKRKYPEARIRIYKNNNQIPSDVAEWYCRWSHPDRVSFLLNQISDEEIRWGKVPFKKALSDVCRSHGRNVGELNDDTIYRNDFLSGEADLKFCAVLLRLADILDFDHTRSPDEIYTYLGLKERKNRRSQQSDMEWQKHLCADGFGFPEGWSGPYELGFVASPDHPAVEYDVRQFLDVIETELDNCIKMLPKCSRRWQDFILPYKIKRDDIHSNGYKYGEYRFTLEQQQILDLFMGENLYSNPYVFVRELLQNAIDTCRHRQFYEEKR